MGVARLGESRESRITIKSIRDMRIVFLPGSVGEQVCLISSYVRLCGCICLLRLLVVMRTPSCVICVRTDFSLLVYNFSFVNIVISVDHMVM